MMRYFRNKRGFLTLLGLIFTLAIILFLCYFMFNVYFKRSSISTNTSNPQTIIDTTRGKIREIEKEHLNELGNIQKQLNQ